MSKKLSPLRQLNIKAKILTVVVLIGIVSMGIAGLQGYWQGRQALEKTAFDNLTAIRETRARQIEGYFGQIRNQFIFIVCATGKSAQQMLDLLLARLPNRRDEELVTAAEEQRKIFQLRLEKLL